ncbi:hypothetical protein [Streptomyces sp. DH37]|uniref:hypothetical protein n=1 Tax=Streptomyces sp. DH37 TaxID=3040122 RepID=UPI002442F80C|nr:hypothetical protein [Streptomyces sp. DH37]MDG9703781.1 hypothetical protein [Streptomyces sp. DH37]
MTQQQQWQATVTADAGGLLVDLHRLGQAVPGATAYDASSGRLTLVWRLEAATLGTATEAALKTARTALRDALGTAPALAEVRVRTAEAAEAEAARPGEQDLMGYAEAAEELGVSRQRVNELERTRDDFPRPVARLRSGPVFTAESIRRFAAGWDRRPGRPRKTA